MLGGGFSSNSQFYYLFFLVTHTHTHTNQNLGYLNQNKIFRGSHFTLKKLNLFWVWFFKILGRVVPYCPFHKHFFIPHFIPLSLFLLFAILMDGYIISTPLRLRWKNALGHSCLKNGQKMMEKLFQYFCQFFLKATLNEPYEQNFNSFSRTFPTKMDLFQSS